MSLFLEHKRTTDSQVLAKGDSVQGNVLIDGSATIGSNCRIGPNVVGASRPGMSMLLKKCYSISIFIFIKSLTEGENQRAKPGRLSAVILNLENLVMFVLNRP